MSEIVYRPPAEHRCKPDPMTWAAPGEIHQCTECGKTWKAYEPPQVYSGTQKVFPDWLPEGRFARWRRERRTKRVPPCGVSDFNAD